MSTIKVKVTRAFCLKGKRQEVDKVIELDGGLAKELNAIGKVTFDVKPSNQKTDATKSAPAKIDDKEADQLTDDVAPEV